jgi:AcrR family transcriptional regulator
MQTPRRRGRPRSTRAREAVREAASRLFAQHGFSTTSVRDIASAAGVDPAVVVREFGSKEALFLQTMSVDEGLRGITDGPLDGLGRRILQRLTTTATDDGAQVYRALMGALDRADVQEYLQKSAERHIIEPLAARLEGGDARLRAELVTAQITGFLTVLWVMRRPALTATPADLLIDTYGRAIQALID